VPSFLRNAFEGLSDRLLDRSQGQAILLFLFLDFFAGGLTGFVLFARVDDFSRITEANQYRLGSTLYGVDKSGQPVPVAEYFRFRRTLLPDSFVADNPQSKVVRAFRAMEDANFESHHGIDLKGIARAMVVNILAGRIKEGASTITQQAARLKFLTFERSFVRKFREAWLAVLMELNYEKPDIMQIYLNEVPMGHGNRGVVAAADFYFGKRVTELDWGEAALLASLTTRPNYYSPLKNPHESRSKVRVVFRRLYETGELSRSEVEAEWKKLNQFYLELNRSPAESAFSTRLNTVPWFSEYVRRKLEPQFGRSKFYEGGLQIYTSLDVTMQQAARKSIREGSKRATASADQRRFRKFDYFDNTYGPAWNLVSDIFGLPPVRARMNRNQRKFDRNFQKNLRDNMLVLNLMAGNRRFNQAIEHHYAVSPEVDEILPVQGALITLEVPSGQIKAMVGGARFGADNQLIRAVDAFRQPGSSFKPVLYASSMEYSARNPDLERPVTAATLFNDTPKIFLMTDGAEWQPENYSTEYSGFILLRRALELSKNMVAIQVPEYIGLKNIHPIITTMTQVERRKHAGQPRAIPYNYSIALGSFAMSPLEMARTYSLFANGGRTVLPHSILKITDAEGEVVFEHEAAEPEQVLDPGTSRVITSMLQGVIENGTGRGVRREGFTRPAAGKTGTTDNQRDAWFVGYTPRYVTALWFGFDRANLSLGRGGTGGGIAAPFWGRYMRRAMRHKPVRSFAFPDAKTVTLEICKRSGKLPNTHCDTKMEEIFHVNNAPKILCNDHTGMEPVSGEGITTVDPYQSAEPDGQNQDILELDGNLN
jgi:penicillin-binding protein 1A